jgi:hypothetical protein
MNDMMGPNRVLHKQSHNQTDPSPLKGSMALTLIARSRHKNLTTLGMTDDSTSTMDEDDALEADAAVKAGVAVAEDEVAAVVAGTMNVNVKLQLPARSSPMLHQLSLHRPCTSQSLTMDNAELKTDRASVEATTHLPPDRWHG